VSKVGHLPSYYIDEWINHIFSDTDFIMVGVGLGACDIFQQNKVWFKRIGWVLGENSPLMFGGR
jgi:hypothetical protein